MTKLEEYKAAMEALVAAAKAEGIRFHVVVGEEGEWLHKAGVVISSNEEIKDVFK